MSSEPVGPVGLCSLGEFQRVLAARLERCRSQGGGFSLAFVEIEGLENAGELGEGQLPEIASFLRRRIRRSDLAAPLKGGRFALLLEGTPDEGARRVGDAIREAAERILAHRGEPTPAGRRKAFVGTAHFPDDGLDGQTLFKAAKRALVRAREEYGHPPLDRPPRTAEGSDPHLDTPAEPAPAGGSDAEPGGRPPVDVRVLVVDDEQSLRHVVSQVLSDEGYAVDAVDSAEAALLAFGRASHDLVVTDIRMGGMDGIELLQKIKELRPGTEVVIMTSYASLETAVAAIRAGAYDYLVKPFEDLELVAAAVNRAAEKIRLVAENRSLIERLRVQNRQLQQTNEILLELAVRDGLTGLHNHRYFQEALAREVQVGRRHGRKFSLVLLDVDHFKHYNDTYGHPEGDKVLRGLAAILRHRLRQSDLSARYGGEEFVLLLPETAKEGARRAAEDLRGLIEAHPFEGGETQPLGKLTVSIGVATFPEDARDAPGLVARADECLYLAKRGGRNRVCVAGEAEQAGGEAGGSAESR